jgi:opacity protein-like surface antigen
VEAQQFFVGVKGGLQYYTSRFAEEDTRERLDSGGKLGYKFGGTVIFPLAENFSFGSEYYYSRKGRKYFYEETTKNDARYNFIEFSAYIRKGYKITFKKDTYPGNWFFNVGPNVMYWINGSGTISDAAEIDYDVIFSEPQDSDYRKNYISGNNRWLFGLDFGTGFSFQTSGKESVTIELRYTHGQTFLGGENSSVINMLGFEDDLRTQYRVLNLSIAYLFDVNLKNLRKGKSTIKKSNSGRR